MKKINATKDVSPSRMTIMLNGYFVTLYEDMAVNPMERNAEKVASMCIGKLFSVNIPTFIAANAAMVNKMVITLRL